MSWLKWYYFVLFSLFLACTKPNMDVPNIQQKLTDHNGAMNDCTIGIADTFSDWTFDASGGYILMDTDGLRSMALSGDTGTLNKEFCKTGKYDKRIPPGLDDAPLDGRRHEGYASQIVLGNYIVAMYHPTFFRDHFITYNHTDGSWIRWDLDGAQNGGPKEYSSGQTPIN